MKEHNAKTIKDGKEPYFWDVLVHKKKRITFEEYCELSRGISSNQLYVFAKRAFSSLALCGFLTYLMVYLAQTLIVSFINIFFTTSDFIQSIQIDVASITFAVIAFPTFYLLTTFMPKVVPKQNNLSFLNLFLFAIASLGLIYLGNIMGLGAAKLVDLITGGNSSSPLDTAVSGLDPFKIIIYFVVFPAVFEELIFRKLLIDRTAFFGETASALFSALFFALYHMNFYQFFYSFMVGYLFSVIYIKSGNIFCTITLHGFINFVGTALPSMLGNVPGFLTVYNLAFMFLGILGIVIILLGLSYAKSKRGRYTAFTSLINDPSVSPPSLEGKAAALATVQNPGMLIFITFAILRFFNVL